MIKINNLNISFNSKSNFSLSIDDLSIETGDYISVIGPNGSGKSTFLKVIAGLNSNYSGDILINNKNLKSISKKHLAKLVAYVPQHNSSFYFYDFTVYDYILTGRFPYINKFAGYSNEDKKIVLEIISYLNLDNYLKRKLVTLSGGELQKVCIGAALAQKSDIILFDEANSFLDYKHKLELDNIFLNLLNRGETIISVTHNINDIAVQDGKTLALKEGNVIYKGKTDYFFENNYLEKVYDVNFLKTNVEKLNKEIYIPYN
jgi:iron complex transport system ATP-binding protein